MAGRRWKWRHAFSLVLLVGLVWLLIEIGGRPGGGSWAVPRSGGAAGDSSSNAASPRAGPANVGASPSNLLPSPDRTGNPAAGRSQAGDPRAGDGNAALADRLGDVLHQVQRAIEQGRIGAAWTALRAAQDWELTAALSVRREAMRRDLLQAQRRALGTLQTMVGAGRILEAECLLAQVREGDEPSVVTALKALAEQRRWAWPAIATDSLPPLPYLDAVPGVERGRPLRARIDGAMVDARFVRQRDEKATIEIRDADGVRYPSVPSHAIEPVAATLDEAVGQCVQAWRDGNREATILWLAYARELGADARVEQLGRALLQ